MLLFFPRPGLAEHLQSRRRKRCKNCSRTKDHRGSSQRKIASRPERAQLLRGRTLSALPSPTGSRHAQSRARFQLRVQAVELGRAWRHVHIGPWRAATSRDVSVPSSNKPNASEALALFTYIRQKNDDQATKRVIPHK